MLAVPVYAKEGFVPRWTYVGDKPFTSVSPIDADKTGYLDHILAGSLDNRVYLFSPNGEVLGYYEAMSSVTSVGSFIHDNDLKFNDGIAGSLDDHVYVFWRPYEMDYFKTSGHWWNYSLGDNVYAVGTFDFNETGQLDGVVAGTGNYADKEYGGVFAFSTNGTLLWSYGTSSAVKILLSGDLDSDNIFSDVIAAAGSEVYVLSVSGSLVWKYDFNDEVLAVSLADFDLDGEKDDLLVGAGNTTYAINSHKEIQWEKRFNGSISGITPVDVDNDELIDYYLVSAGRTLYALKNDPKKTDVLWDYTLDHSIGRHVGVDFDSDGVLDDIVVITGKILYAYDFDYLYLPELYVSKSSSRNAVKVGDKVTINLNLKNNGRGIVKSISYTDRLPEGLTLVDGNLSMDNIMISALGDAKLSYTIEALKEGEYVLPPVEISFIDGYGKSYVAISNSLNLTVTGTSAGERNITITDTPGAPLLEIRRIVSDTEVAEGENITVVVSLINQGESPALTVNFEDSLPPGFVLSEGEASWMGVLEPGEKKDIHYSLHLTDPQKASPRTVLKAPTVYYRDESGNVYEAQGEETIINVAGGPLQDNKKILLAAGIILAVSALMFRRMFTSEKVDPKLEEKFIQVYIRYQKMGKRPTYQEMKEELGVELKDIEVIVKRVKKRFGISPMTSIFSRIRSLKK